MNNNGGKKELHGKGGSDLRCYRTKITLTVFPIGSGKQSCTFHIYLGGLEWCL